MRNYPDTYPFLEPCLGCFENGLQQLSEKEENIIFLTNGDLSVNRLMDAMAKLVPGASVSLCFYMLCLRTAQHIHTLLKTKQVEQVNVYCTYKEEYVQDILDKTDQFFCVEKGCDFYLVVFENKDRRIMVGGYIPQTAGRGTINLCTLYNNVETQSLLMRTLKRFYK